MRLVQINVAMIMPDVGLLVTPTSPTIRALTVTQKKAKMTTRTAIPIRNMKFQASMEGRSKGSAVMTPMIGTRR